MPSPLRCGSPSMRYRGAGCTTARDAHAPPSSEGAELTTWAGRVLSGQKRQGKSSDAAASPPSVDMTQDRVMGSLRSSMRDMVNALSNALLYSAQFCRHERAFHA